MSGTDSRPQGRRSARGGGGDLTDVATARAVARRAGLVPKHALGQHLLVDRGVLDALVAALDPGPTDEVLEIGPGLGTLTLELALRARRVVAVELDANAARAARATTRGVGDVTVLEADALSIGPADAGLGPGWLAAGNIPYLITGALLRHLMERDDPPRRAVLLVQREVARRLAAGPGSWSLATVAVRAVAEAERLVDVPPTSFDPAPRVWSSILRLTPRLGVPVEERARVLGLARAVFQMRRKMIHHGLAHALGGPSSAVAAILGDAGIPSTIRPGELDLAGWRELAAAVERANCTVVGPRSGWEDILADDQA